jgi:molybdenum cofactor cytidylyltransferase
MQFGCSNRRLVCWQYIRGGCTYLSMQLVALIPAAGKGSRYGMPKVDAMYNGITFSEMILNTLRESGIESCHVIRDIETPDMLASIKHGIKEITEAGINPDGWLIWPVDHPTVKPDTIRFMSKIFEFRHNSIVIPRYESKNGHPIIIPAILAIPDQSPVNGLKEVIMLSHLPVHFVEVNDPGILVNINTPEDVKYV